MPIEKPTKPLNLVPRSFGGEKTNFSEDLQSSGFEPNIPQTYNGDNLNYQIDATGKELDYVEKVVDFINNAPINHVPFVNENNQLDYIAKDSLGGSGVEIGDIGFTQMAIDEAKGKRRKLNGQIIIQEQYQKLTDFLKTSIAQNPDMACTEQEWQAEIKMSTAGICYKFVIDDVGGTIRLPKYPDYFIGNITVPSGNIPVVGNGKALGFINSKTMSGVFNIESTRAGNTADYVIVSAEFSNTSDVGTDLSQGGSRNGAWGLTQNKNNSGLVAKLGEASTEKIKGTYFIQVATGAETEDNIINEIELNNPYSLGDSKYSPVALNNISWLKSEGQYNSKAIYPAYYEWLLKIYNGVEVADSVSVKLTTEEYTDYDWVLNTADETFRLPLLNGSEDLPSDNAQFVDVTATEFTMPYNGYLYLVAELKSDNYCILLVDGIEKWHFTSSNAYYHRGGSTTFIRKGQSIKLSGAYMYKRYEKAQGNGSLYFYVGETVQNANLINAGRIEEKIANIIPDNSSLISSYGMPSSKYIDLTIGATGTQFTTPANGWFVVWVQGGTTTNNKYLEIINDTTGISQGVYGTSNFNYKCHLPAKKGDKVTVQYNGMGSAPNRCRFIYSEGEV